MRCSTTLIALALAGSACATTSTIHTDPSGAEVFINGQRCGESPCIYHSRYGFPERMRVQIRHPGHRSLEFFVDTEAPLASYALLGFGSYIFHTFDKEYRFRLAKEGVGRKKAPKQKPARSSAWPGELAAANAIEQCLYWEKQAGAAADDKFAKRSRDNDCARAAVLAEQAVDRASTDSAALAVALLEFDHLRQQQGAPPLIPSSRLEPLCNRALVEYARRSGAASEPEEYPAFATLCPAQHELLRSP